LLKTSVSDTNTSSRMFTSFSGVSLSMTVCCSPCYTSIIHCFSSLTSRIFFWALLHLHCFTDFTVTEFRLELLRRLYILQDEFW